MKKYLSILMAVIVSVMGLAVPVRAEELPTLPPLIISELRLGGLGAGGVADGKQEFIELYNSGDEPLDVTGWKLEYLSAAHTGMGAPTRVLAELEGLADPLGFVLVGPTGLSDADITWNMPTSASGHLAQGGGHIRLVNAVGQVVELLSWGGAKTIGSWTKLADIPAGRSAQLILPHHEAFTGVVQYIVSNESSPTGGGLVVELPPVRNCNLRLSEILPNPAGTDAGHEYIELYNPTAMPQPLADCSLRIGEAAEPLKLPEQLVAPDAYIIVDDGVGFNLPNASAATVWLSGDILQESVRYPDALQDDQVWWLRNGAWEMSRVGTPGAINELQPEKMPPTVLAAAHLPDECPAGKERNPETGRCRAIPTAVSQPEPCKPGQTRNTETGRCRAVATSIASTPVACKPGQERNAETNRCRNITTASATPKPCPEGQVRNTETNRCRKQPTAPMALAKVEDVSGQGQSAMRWGVIAAVVAGLGGYALYEWRHDALNALHRWQPKGSKRQPHWKFWREGGTIKNK